MLRKAIYIFLVLSVVLSMLLWSFGVGAQWKMPRVYLFHSKDCPHCVEEIKFLTKLKTEMLGLEVATFEISENKLDQAAFKAVAGAFNLPVGGVPLTIIGQDMVSGFDNEKSIGETIKAAIQKNIGVTDLLEPIILQASPDFLKKNLIKTAEPQKVDQPQIVQNGAKTMQLPIFGKINIGKLSLPILTVVLGFADGFNPCAMWILVFLITLLLGQSWKRRLILGGTFIFISGFVYFLFMVAWLNFFLFVGLNFWIRLIVGGLAVVMGVLQLKRFFEKPNVGCAIAGAEQKRSIVQRVKEVVQRKNLWLALAGLVIIAAGVNLLEMFCSLGLPAIYTNVLSASNLVTWKYYAYLLGYIFFYILDDIVVFVIAMATLKITGVENKYKRFINLVGGVIILLIGILLLFKPGWLMFS
ncbi:MAG: hypothetical protein V1902_02830 [Candidatus Falkowbacteria bacterium]